MLAATVSDAALRKYDPSQPRVSAGNPDGGQWTVEGFVQWVREGTARQSLVEYTAKPQISRPVVPPSPPEQSYVTSLNGINFIARHEVFVAHVYVDQAGHDTVGYGHKLLPEESFPSGITREEARILLRDDIGIAEAAVRNNVRVVLSAQQFDALIALTYNIGAYAFRHSTLLRLLNRGDYSGAADQFPSWNLGWDPKLKRRVVSQGLINRRNFELNLFQNGVYE